MNAIINYSLNKFCPYIIILFVLFYNSGLDLWRSIIVIGACMFIDKFAFNAGYSYAYCKKHNIPLDDQ
jgi:hypothetical protein